MAQVDVLSIIREEAYYFAPQGQTKIMNEGWASFWHSTIMTRQGLTAAEVVNYADHHSGTMASSPTQLNPYKLGIELLRDIEDRWNRGAFGKEVRQACIRKGDLIVRFGEQTKHHNAGQFHAQLRLNFFDRTPCCR